MSSNGSGKLNTSKSSSARRTATGSSSGKNGKEELHKRSTNGENGEEEEGGVVKREREKIRYREWMREERQRIK